MIPSSQPESQIHYQARFVTKEANCLQQRFAIALLLNLNPEQIYRIDCWRYVIHVVGKGISTFVSYADLPPILGVKPPNPQDFSIWRKRWQKNQHQAPKFWTEFYAQKFRTVPTLLEMYTWGKLVNLVKSVMPSSEVQWLRNLYIQEKQAINNF